MAKYIKKPVAVEAVQLNKHNLFNVISFLEGKKPDIRSNIACDNWEGYKKEVLSDGYLMIHTLEGDMKASFNDYIIRGVNGEFYPCKPGIFKKTYYTEEEYAELNQCSF